MLCRVGVLAVSGLLASQSAWAEDVRITASLDRHITTINGRPQVIERIQDPEHRLSGDFTKTSRPCPPFCIAPIEAAPGVATLGEVEVIDFIDSHVAAGTGLLLDSRVPQWFAQGTIPGAVNVPFSTLDPANPYRDDILAALGARHDGQEWDFGDAKELLLFCNGPWCDQAPRAIRNLRAAGYPAEKLHYYRGGMQLWLLLGLTVAEAG